MSREKTLSLWKHNKRSGLWDHQRSVTPETKDEWKKIHQKDEPDAHFHVSTNKPKHNPMVKEDAPVNSTGPAVVGTGDSGITWRPAKRGKFAGNETFMFRREQFMKFKTLQKENRKWWKTYIGEDDDYINEVREYARKHPKKPIVFECEDTGYLFFAKY